MYVIRPSNRVVIGLLLSAVLWTSPSIALLDNGDGIYLDQLTEWDLGQADRFYTNSSSSSLAWGEAYVLRVFVEGYLITGDSYWLGRITEHVDVILGNMKDVPDTGAYHPTYADGFLGWGTPGGTYTPQWDEFIVHDGHVGAPLSQFVAMVYQDSELWTEFGGKAQAYLDTLRRHVAGKWLSYWEGHPDSAGITWRQWGGFRSTPHNQYSAFGSMLLFLDDAVSSGRYRAQHPDEPQPNYRDLAIKMGGNLKGGLTLLANGGYRWPYSTNLSESFEDISHANLELEFAMYLHERGLVFDTIDVARFAKTFTELVWNRDLITPLFYHTVGGTGEPATLGKAPIWGWVLYSRGDPLVWLLANRHFQTSSGAVSPHFMVAMSRLTRLRQLARGLVMPTKVSVVDDGDRVLRPGETAKLKLTISNEGPFYDSTCVDVSLPPTLTPTGPLQLSGATGRVSQAVDGCVPLYLEPADTASLEVEVIVSLTAPSARASIEISAGRHSINRQVTVGSPPILAVEWMDTKPSELFESVGDLMHRWTHESDGALSAEILSKFEIVIWRGIHATPTAQERVALAGYLDGDGKLLMFSAGALSDLIHRSFEDSLFIADYLGVYDAIDVQDSLAGINVFAQSTGGVFAGIGPYGARLLSGPEVVPGIHLDVMSSNARPDFRLEIRTFDEATREEPPLPHPIVGLGVDSSYRALVYGWDIADFQVPILSTQVLAEALDWLQHPSAIATPAANSP
ncbi:MAG: hypothetical protein QGH20_04970, partial [Candidatus Latescibacteria bacterium]|nr:hypothetical protein [Candidatus Latescibacterota bacterium]